MFKTKSLLKKIIICIISSIFTLIVSIVSIEIYLRFTLHPYPKVTNSKGTNRNLGYTAMPGEKGLYKFLDNENKMRYIPYQINSLGYRDIEHSITKPKNIKRIMMFGDSFLAGHQVDFENILSRQLSKNLEHIYNKKYEIFNFGLIGNQPSTELLTLENLALKYSPDYVIICFFQNDPMDLSEKLENGETIKEIWHHILSDTNELILVKPDIEKKSLRRKINSFLRENTFIYNWQKEKINNLKNNLRKNHDLFLKLKSFDKLFLKELPEEIEKNWTLTLKIYEKILQISKENNFKIIILNIPSANMFDKQKLKSYINKFEETKNSEIEPHNAHIRLEKFCREKNIDYVYPFEIFSKYKTEDLYFINDGHLTEKGHKILAKILSDKIIELEK